MLSPPGTHEPAVPTSPAASPVVPRVVKKLRLTEDAWAALDAYCERHHVTFTALAESIGLHMADHPDWMPEEVAQRAQRIDRERYSRRPRD